MDDFLLPGSNLIEMLIQPDNTTCMLTVLHFQFPKLNILSRDGRCGTVCGHLRGPYESPKWIFSYVTVFNGLGFDDFVITINSFIYCPNRMTYILHFESEK